MTADMVDDDGITPADACPGCGCQPGDGVTRGCSDPDGCGFFDELSRPDLYGDMLLEVE